MRRGTFPGRLGLLWRLGLGHGQGFGLLGMKLLRLVAARGAGSSGSGCWRQRRPGRASGGGPSLCRSPSGRARFALPLPLLVRVAVVMSVAVTPGVVVRGLLCRRCRRCLARTRIGT